MALFPRDGSLPTLNLMEVQFKHILKELILTCSRRQTINNDQIIMIEMFIESTSLKGFCMTDFNIVETNEIASRRIILACTKVPNLILRCATLSQFAAVATLLGYPRSVVSELSLFMGQSDIDERGMSIIAEALVNNATLKTLHVCGFNLPWNPLAKALCDTSSIGAIIGSNHTIEKIRPMVCDLPPVLQDYCTLNRETNKEQTIRTKIARYFFQEEIELSTFANMDMKHIPRVLAMIGGGETNRNAAIFREEDAINQQSAIFRLLKCIPDICNVSSRDASLVDAHGAGEGSSNKRQKVSQ